MTELIDKKNLFNNLFVRNGKVCPNSDIDNFPTTIDVKEVKKAILEQPTITKAELRASVIDEFAERLKPCLNTYYDRVQTKRVAEQMKGEEK